MVHVAQVQSLKEQELLEAAKQIDDLQTQLKDGENTITLLRMQDETLKKEIRELERHKKKREGANLEYLKNVTLKFMSTGDQEQERLLPVLANLLQFSPEEIQNLTASKKSQTFWPKLFGSPSKK